MWYEILPSAGLVFAFLYFPAWTNWAGNKLRLNGKSQVRNWEAAYYLDWNVYLRDKRITGSEYVPRGLESVPDLK